MRQPLSIFVVWHPNFEEGQEYANFIYAIYCRDIDNPLTRGIGIPVYFRFETAQNQSHPMSIDPAQSEHTVIILLIDDEMYDDEEWNSYVDNLIDLKEDEDTVTIFPVAFTNYAYDLREAISALQFISLQSIVHSDGNQAFTLRKQTLQSELTHDLCKIVLPTQQKNKERKPIKIFISHAKADGELLGKQFRDYINSQSKLKTFFDTNDIANGYAFAQEIKDAIHESVLVAFQTDRYASREWCRLEVIIAKQHECPIVVVDALEVGEKRSFPYIGNVPTLRWNNNFDQIVDAALLQVLASAHNKLQMKKWVELFALEDQFNVKVIPFAPELFGLLAIKEKVQSEEQQVLIVYPDPPLGKEETRLLQQFDEHITFTTPLLLPSFAHLK